VSVRGPELDAAAAAMVGEGARFVVIGGFAVIANRFVRATEDIDFLVPSVTPSRCAPSICADRRTYAR
jgi:hypothetical protein